MDGGDIDLGLLAVHPHPDDETIACGGVLARYVDEGLRVAVVTCTGGEEGSNLAGIDLGGRPLPEVRRDELADALAVLGVTAHTFLGFRDSGMAGWATNDRPDSFHQADLDEAAGRLAAIVRRLRPQVVVSDDEQGGYGHPDHVKANRVTVRAVELAADPSAAIEGEPWQVAKRYVHSLPRSRMLAAHRELLDRGLASPWGEEPIEDAEQLDFGVPDDEITTEVDVGDWLDRKQRAIAAHRSQVAADSLFLNLPDDLAQRFFGSEAFVLREGELGVPPGRTEGDLFAGLR